MPLQFRVSNMGLKFSPTPQEICKDFKAFKFEFKIIRILKN